MPTEDNCFTRRNINTMCKSVAPQIEVNQRARYADASQAEPQRYKLRPIFNKDRYYVAMLETLITAKHI